MTTTVAPEAEPLESLTDEELTALALGADPDAPVDDDAVCLWDVTDSGANQLLPEWYMPSPLGGARNFSGWRKRVVLAVIASFLIIDAYGLCNTYGVVGFG